MALRPWAPLAIALVAGAVEMAAQASRLPAQAAPRVRDPQFVECRDGQPTRQTSGSNVRCPVADGVGVSIEVAPSPAVYENNAPCPQRSIESVMRSVLSAAAAERGRVKSSSTADLPAFWTSLKQRVMAATIRTSSDPADLLTGTSRVRGASTCQALVVAVAMPPKGIKALDFRAGSPRDTSTCFSARISPASPSGSVPSQTQALPGGAYTVAPGKGLCSIGWSAWEAAAAVADPQGGTIIGAVFKNWSGNLPRTAELWVTF